MGVLKGALIAALVCGLSVSGCSNIDRFDVPKDGRGSPTVESITKRVVCELAVIAADDYPYKQLVDAGDFIVGVELDLSVNDDGSLTPTFTYLNGTSFMFNAGAKLDASREQQFTEQLFYSIAEIRDTMKYDKLKSAQLGRKIDSLHCPEVDTNLAGDLGIVKSVDMAMHSDGLDLNTKLGGAKGAFGGYINFIVTKNLNAVGPTFSLTHFKGPSSLAGVAEVNNDKLTFAFAERKAPGDLLDDAGKKNKKSNKKMTNGGTSNLVDHNAKNTALNLISTIQNTQITTQLSGIRSDLH